MTLQNVLWETVGQTLVDSIGADKVYEFPPVDHVASAVIRSVSVTGQKRQKDYLNGTAYVLIDFYNTDRNALTEDMDNFRTSIGRVAHVIGDGLDENQDVIRDEGNWLYHGDMTIPFMF